MDKIVKFSALAIFVGFWANTASAAPLEATIAQSLLNHPDVKQAYDNYVTRTHQIDQAKAGYYPKVDLVAGVGPDRYDSDTDDNKTLTYQETYLSLNQILFDGFETISNVDRTKAEAEAQRHAVYAQANNSALRVAEVYLNVLRYQEIAQLS